ncbi:MAG TPA: hypothetical protein VLM41_01005 [Steroidobacteraceae bacterium]|nr:hypothetical protein [Steroidobacteraceae bacterium]
MLVAVVTALLAAARAVARRGPAATAYLLLAAMLAVVGWNLWRLAPDLGSYEPLRTGQPVAELYFERTGAGRFRATLTRLPEGRMAIYELRGELWRIGIRRLQWLPADWDPGLGQRYRLERLEARPADDAEATADDRSAYPLVVQTGHDLWSQAAGGGSAARLIAADYDESGWRPLRHEARLRVQIGAEGLMIEPMNAAAEALASQAPGRTRASAERLR